MNDCGLGVAYLLCFQFYYAYENCKYCVHISKEKKILQNYINFLDALEENRELSFPSERYYRDQVKTFKGGRIRIKLHVRG